MSRLILTTLLCALLGGCVPTRSFQTVATDGLSAGAIFQRGALTTGVMRSGESILLDGVIPAGDMLCGRGLDPPCFMASDLAEVTVASPPRFTAKDWAIQSPLIVLSVALSPLYLLPTPRQPGWLEQPDNPCVESGETAVAETVNSGSAKAETAALAALISKHHDLTGRCLLFASFAAQPTDLNRRLWFKAQARLRFEERACVEDAGQADTTWRWNLPRGEQMDEMGIATWPDELRAVLSDPATFDYPGLAKVCAERGGVKADLTEAVDRAREAWPLPTPL
ncbi:hypothetical protein [Brevundimonas sp. TSRC1-1]|uniref:hypothetical protein n=1 Tax=Brevundimonas sp. TSRC1-1 TaxID=2804562 RepID=UPI003CEA7928